jgi:short-subunit dehydrogenase
MLASGEQGHVINTASMGALLTSPFVGPYATAKHAVVGLSKGLRLNSPTPRSA